MKKFLIAILSIFFLLLLSRENAYAYTSEEVGDHSSSSSCWVIFEGSVYDITKYISQHDRYLDIREWCGKDMTDDFKNKDGRGIDHKNSSYALLENYKIGEIASVPENTSTINSSNEVETTNTQDPVLIDGTEKPKEYNLLIPVLVSLFSYWLVYFIAKNKNFLGITILKFNGFFNTLLFLSLLLPSFGFGIFMVLRTQIPSLYDIDFEFLYWHVELSLVMGTLAVSHFIQRFFIYIKQILK